MMLFNNDCHDILDCLEENSVDMVLTDPPYSTTKHKWDSPLDWSVIWKHLRRVVKPNGAIVLFAQMPFSATLVSSNLENYKHFWTWHKKLPGNFAVAKYMPLSVTEDIYVFTPNGERVNYYPQMVTGKPRYKGGKSQNSGKGFGGLDPIIKYNDQYYPKSLLEFKPVTRSKSLHPSQKPVDLLKYLIETYTLESQTVLDFTMGVGSTGVAAKELNRCFVGIELDKLYFNLAKERLFS